MKIIRITVLSVFIFSAYFFAGCKKSADNLFTNEYQNVMRENALFQATTDDILKVVENILMNNSNAKIETTGAPLGCITNIDTLVTGPNSKTYTIVFSSGCTSYDGKVRNGTMIVELSGTNYNTTGSSITVRFSNFYLNSNQLQGKIVSTNLGSGVFKVVVSDEGGSGYATINIAQFGKNTSWKSTHKRAIYEGNADMIIINNKYKITGADPDIFAFEGITTDDKYYSGSLTAELVLDYNCLASGYLRYPTSGEIEFKIGNNFRYVDYGDGTCDYVVLMKVRSSATAFALY